jgi:hypothetical protein
MNEKTHEKVNESETVENERKRREMLIALAELKGDQLLLDAARGDAEAMAKYEHRVEEKFAESAQKLVEEVRANPSKWAEKIANAGAGLVRASVLQQMGAKLTIAVLRKTIREASLVCAALERMGHDAHPFGWSDPEKNASMEGLTFDIVDEASPDDECVAGPHSVVRREARAHLRRHAIEAVSFCDPSPADEAASEAKCSDHLDPWPDDEPLTPATAARLLHDDFALTLEEQTCILDALGCIDRQVNERGHERARRDSVETILAHIGDLQHDAIRWQELQRAKAEPEASDPAVVLGAVGEAGSFVVEAGNEEPETIDARSSLGRAVQLRGGQGSRGVHTMASLPQHTNVHGVWCDAVIIASETPNGIVTSLVPVAALEVV